MLEQGYSKAKVAERFNISRGTLYKYLNMSPNEMSTWLASCKTRRKKLDVFKGMILNWLRDYPDVTAAQIYDWLQDRFPEFKVGESSVRSYVRNLRKEYNLPKTKEERQYQAVEDMPKGQQAQVDFGQIKVKTSQGKIVKLYFVAFVLSNSRYKYVEWLNRPFTTKDLILAHENAFQYFGGIPYEIVYDQDRIIIVSENYGDLIMTKEFEVYRLSRHLKLYMCRSSDPQSKGKIENVVGFVKKNFAKYRIFTNIGVWNEQCLRWLERTGNGKIHNMTKKRPVEVFQEEKKHLRPVLPLIDATNINKQSYTNVNSSIARTVRKDNTILFKSNRYSVPLGTYSPFGKIVSLVVEETLLKIIDHETGELIGEHEISQEVGKLIQDRKHTRDRNKGIAEFIDLVANQFENKEIALEYIGNVREAYPRYIRDQLQLMSKHIDQATPKEKNEALHQCMKLKLFSASEFADMLEHIKRQRQINNTVPTANDKVVHPLHAHGSAALHAKPVLRNIDEYISIMEGS